MLRGIGTSGGIGIGKAIVIRQPDSKLPRYVCKDSDAEWARFCEARTAFVEETSDLEEKLSQKLGENDKNALVLKNQIYLINDIEIEKAVMDNIATSSMNAEAAFYDACENLINIFSAMKSDIMNQRIADICDMRERICQILMGVVQVDLERLPENTILIAEEIHPSMTARLDTSHVVGIVAERGGDTSHAAILARALEIPAVLSVKNACDIFSDGADVIVDGEYGEVFSNPLEITVKIYLKKQAKYQDKRAQLVQYKDKETVTLDGKVISLYANIGDAAEAEMGMKNSCEGVGLFRTEFMYMNNVKLPNEEEQLEQYRKAAVLLKGKPLVIRTLDIGGDKNIAYMGLSKEANPFLGYRAIRYCLDRVDVFTTQLRAILRASAYGNIRIMLPMISTISEIRYAKKIINDIKKDLDKHNIKYDKDIKVGIMVETPAAAVMSDAFAKEVDFFSIGTNDLTQYIMAVDRGNENVSYLYSPFNPAVLRMIKHIIKSGHDAGIEVGMCGEAAGNSYMTPLLISFGLDEFSVSPSKILETRKNISQWSKAAADKVAENVMTMTNVKEIQDYLSERYKD